MWINSHYLQLYCNTPFRHRWNRTVDQPGNVSERYIHVVRTVGQTRNVSELYIHVVITQLFGAATSHADYLYASVWAHALGYHFYTLVQQALLMFMCHNWWRTKLITRPFDLFKPNNPCRRIYLNRTSTDMIPQNPCLSPQYQYAAISIIFADPGGRTAQHVGQRLLGCSNCGFEFRREYGCLLWVWCVVKQKY